MPRGVSRSDAARLQARLWTPKAMLGELQLWLDAADTSTIAGGTGVFSWGDKSGRHVQMEQGAGANQPTYVQNGIGGLPALDFTTSHWMRSQLGYWNSAVADFGVSMVGMITSASDTHARLLAFVSSTTALDYDDANGMALVHRETTTARLQTHKKTDNEVGLSIITYDVPFIHSWRCDAGVFTPFVDGVTQTADTMNPSMGSGANNEGYFLHGCIDYSGTSSRFDGMLGEIVVTRTRLAQMYQDKLEGYLAHKWGLTNQLVASHTYKNAPPLIGA